MKLPALVEQVLTALRPALGLSAPVGTEDAWSVAGTKGSIEARCTSGSDYDGTVTTWRLKVLAPGVKSLVVEVEDVSVAGWYLRVETTKAPAELVLLDVLKAAGLDPEER